MRALSRGAITVALIVAALGCRKKQVEPSRSTSSSNSATAGSTGPLAVDFPSRDGKSWVNGAPRMLADARGDVVLVEVWHRL